jgi:hypothetical protein
MVQNRARTKDRRDFFKVVLQKTKTLIRGRGNGKAAV